MNLLALLSHTDLFGPLSQKSKARIAEIAIEKKYSKNRQIFREGEQGTAVYLLTAGEVQIYKSSPTGDRQVVIKNIKPGEIFAEAILFEKDRFPASAQALKDSILFYFPKKQFIELLGSTDFRNEFIKILLQKQRYLTERLRSLVTMDVDEKLFHYLQEHYGPKERIVPGVSKKDLAASIDTTPETLSRTLLQLKKKGILVWDGKEIVLRRGFWEAYDKKND